MTAVDEARPTVQIRAAVPPFQTRSRASGAAVLVAVLGGVLTALAFPPVSAWPLAAVGPGLLVVAAQLLVVQTNNATYMRDRQLGETLQQLDMARVRAVEHDRAAVVASTTGISAIIAPDGSLTATTGPWRSQVLVGTVELRDTPPRSAGPWVEPLAAAVVLGALVPMVARRRGSRVEVRPWA